MQKWRSRVLMYSRRWDPGICVGDWFIKEFQERDSDDWKKGFPSNQSGIDLRFNKENLGKIRKWKLWIDRCRAPIIIKQDQARRNWFLEVYLA
ncbi:BnaC09g40770D [Brassica napus]|uniref:BnaC09g40770D protein n=1 Tax=Brassica napus TaxID=3708 RepID=A0A078FR39_BRANA|nr:BnaC09g40770D [Brassica napus]